MDKFNTALAGYGETAPINWAAHNVGITPSFFVRTEPRLDADGKPILDAAGKPDEHSMECCRVQISGDAFTEAVMPVDDLVRERFADQYRRWKENDLSINGTALTDWADGALSARMTRDLNDLNIFSVENLASLADIFVSRIIDGRSLRSKAQLWLEGRPKALAQSEIAILKAANEALMKRLEAVEKAGAPRRRPSGAMQRRLAALRARKETQPVTINQTPSPHA